MYFGKVAKDHYFELFHSKQEGCKSPKKAHGDVEDI